ncbi:hypothetical protein M427DRAFT_264296 [Gonapodya prolifera JEL478]|uniref:ZZ-type domain-containing protein n=1 Tax=Gonapodya prolifera (strain JEL478) TaxID=1344416 RepID=A0A139AK45_GONPJ|nr:hypothetical protein M427DRAFT_264296 [Gonapodya prolifera JEL478]|eukprot:KXS17152.1 hypothetical protein M427DRAFT_264296 [Gonapodya prolifera JEL478]
MSRDFKNLRPPPRSNSVGQTQSGAAPLWPTVYCDRCRLHGLSERFKCLVCVDFDLCKQCYGDAERIHPGHRFGLVMPLPRRGDTTTFGGRRPVWPGVHCDGCLSTGLHERYKCQSCPDYDLCTNCFTDVLRRHPGHQFRLFLPPTTAPNIPAQPPFAREIALSQRGVPWPTISCNGCGLQGVHDRFKCRTCPNYDLCKPCHKSAAYIHPGHQFGLLYPAAIDADHSTPVWYGIFCDHCGLENIPQRYKCAECPDYDLCHSCFGSVAFIHPQHTFRLLHPQPRGQPRPPVLDQRNFWTSVTCDSCDRKGLDSRFKCQSCPDYDLCGSCYRFRGSVHPGHEFGLEYPPASRIQSKDRSQMSGEEVFIVGGQTACSICRKTNLQAWLKVGNTNLLRYYIPNRRCLMFVVVLSAIPRATMIIMSAKIASKKAVLDHRIGISNLCWCGKKPRNYIVDMAEMHVKVSTKALTGHPPQR